MLYSVLYHYSLRLYCALTTLTCHTLSGGLHALSLSLHALSLSLQQFSACSRYGRLRSLIELIFELSADLAEIDRHRASIGCGDRTHIQYALQTISDLTSNSDLFSHLMLSPILRDMTTSNTATQLPVLVIGSGLGGLTLAHSLQKHQIPYRLFERDSAASQRAQGYRVSIDSGGASGLKAACTPEVFQQFEKTSAEEHRAGGRLNAVSGQVERSGVLGLLGTGGVGMLWRLSTRLLGKRWERANLSAVVGWTMSWSKFIHIVSTSKGDGLTVTTPPNPLPTAPNGATKDYKIDRRVLRSVLLKSQTDHIDFNHEFSHYTQSNASPNEITAHFTHRASVTGSLLIGADGTGSKIAKQLIGPSLSAPVDLGARIIYGKTPLTADVEKKLNSALQKGASFVVDDSGHKRKLMVCEAIRFTHLGAPEDYIFWALVGQKEVFDVRSSEKDQPISNLQGEKAKAITEELTARWHPSIKVILDEPSTDETAMLRLTSSNPSGAPHWTTENRVTVLGDAIHCMPPTGGQGANSAMRDAAMLGDVLETIQTIWCGVELGNNQAVRGRYEI